jgi:hypothetical protein
MISKQNIRALLLCCSFLWPILSVAEDNSGTNPVNFTYDFRVYSELAQLPNDAGSSALTTAELRVPLGRDIAYLSDDPEESPFYDMGSRWQLRFRAKYKNLSLENPANPPFGASEVSGIGDFDARLLWIASASKKMVIAAGLEAFMDTASNDALGNGQTVLGPTAFAVFPGILGPGSLFAPGYFPASWDPAVCSRPGTSMSLMLVVAMASRTSAAANWISILSGVWPEAGTGSSSIRR